MKAKQKGKCSMATLNVRMESGKRFVQPVLKASEVANTAEKITNVINSLVDKAPATTKAGDELKAFRWNKDLFAVALAEFIGEYTRTLAIEALRERKARASADGAAPAEEIVSL